MTPTKEKPASGCNHAAGSPKHNDPNILPDIEQSINALDYVRELATANQAQLLTKAAAFASLHAPHTLWQRQMKIGTATFLIRLEWPGVMVVYDPKTGSERARAAPGAPGSLQKQA